MKKQIKKLNLNKRTISNLGTPEMSKIAGGSDGYTDCHGHSCRGNCGGGGGQTRNGNTCLLHNTCNTC